MSAASRRKGLTGEREAADLFTAAGWEVRGLESSGDWLAFGPWPVPKAYRRVTLHVEVKRYAARARFPEWLAQAAAEAPPGVPPLLVTRADRGEWVACLPLADLLEIIG